MVGLKPLKKTKGVKMVGKVKLPLKGSNGTTDEGVFGTSN